VLLGVIVAWALNFSITKHLFDEGLQPLVFSSLRYVVAGVLLAGFTLWREGTLRLERRDLLLLLAVGACCNWVNQVAFAYAVDLSGVTTTALIIGIVPVLTVLVAAVFKVERLSRRIAVAGGVSFAGAALVVLGSGGSVHGSVLGELAAIATALTWSVYTVMLKPLSARYSPLRIFTIVLLEVSVLLLFTAIPQFRTQDWSLGTTTWVLLGVSALVPLLLANVAFIFCVERIGPSRASLFSNLQPVFATLFGVVLLAEEITVLQCAGGLLIGVAVVVARRRSRTGDTPRNGVAGRALRGMVRRPPGG
jgi:drug/metabolite transporter (DMT)-like permease